MLRVELPQLVAGRSLADQLVDALGDVADREVTVDATQLASGTSSFAAQLVQRVLVDGRATRMVVLGGPEEFVGYCKRAAQKLHVEPRISLRPTQPV